MKNTSAKNGKTRLFDSFQSELLKKKIINLLGTTTATGFARVEQGKKEEQRISESLILIGIYFCKN